MSSTTEHSLYAALVGTVAIGIVSVLFTTRPAAAHHHHHQHSSRPAGYITHTDSVPSFATADPVWFNTPQQVATEPRRHHARRHRTASHHGEPTSGIVTVETLAGKIRVAAKYADRFEGFINDLVAEGHKPRDIGCASWGHMAHSKHHWGGACDIDQTARNRTSSFMYHVTQLAHAHGLTDGCEWSYRDCGHVEVPGSTHVAAIHRRHYAMRRRSHHEAAQVVTTVNYY